MVVTNSCSDQVCSDPHDAELHLQWKMPLPLVLTLGRETEISLCITDSAIPDECPYSAGSHTVEVLISINRWSDQSNTWLPMVSTTYFVNKPKQGSSEELSFFVVFNEPGYYRLDGTIVGEATNYTPGNTASMEIDIP